MDRRVTPPKRVTSPTWGPPPPCKQALNLPAMLELIHEQKSFIKSTTGGSFDRLEIGAFLCSVHWV